MEVVIISCWGLFGDGLRPLCRGGAVLGALLAPLLPMLGVKKKAVAWRGDGCSVGQGGDGERAEQERVRFHGGRAGASMLSDAQRLPDSEETAWCAVMRG